MKNNEVKDYNRIKLVESIIKKMTGRYTVVDAVENLINGTIDICVSDETERETAKMMVSLTKEGIEKNKR